MSKKARFLFLIIIKCCILIIMINIFEFSNLSPAGNERQQERSHLLVDTLGCKIPKINPFDDSIQRFIKPGIKLTCSYDKDIVYSEGNQLKINHYSNARSLGLQYCKYEVIWRPPDIKTDHDYFILKNQSESFTDTVTIKDDFILVTCYNDINVTVYRNAFSFIHEKLSVEKRSNKAFKTFSHSSEFISILMVGIDSISRNNMIRFMPKTREYLQKKMGALEYLGYNKVADNTFLNLVPMTTGKFVHELPWNASMTNITFDKFNFIWKNFSENGYRTLYSEDSPHGQIFDYEKAGFSIPTADYFDRPFTLALEEMGDVWNQNHHCVHGRPGTKISLDYTKQFVQKFKDRPYFSFTFITRLTHDVLQDAYKADGLYLEFLKSIHEGSNLNNTMLVFFSDHGIRFGGFRQTFVGKIEERLPFLFFVVPEWFKKKYETLYTNLIINRRRLITPFDIYQTLKHLLIFPKTPVDSYGRSFSLLLPISSERTCEQATILPHWCTCLEEAKLNLTNAIVKMVAQSFVKSLNNILLSYKQCTKLDLKQVLSATKFLPSDVVLKYIQTSHKKDKSEIHFGEKVKTHVDYQLMLETSPGGGVFEVTMRHDEINNTTERVGDISRLSMYGKTSHCVQGIELKKICYCKIQI